MPDNTLQFETRVNLAGLNSGIAEAQAQITGLSSSVKQAMADAKAATDNLSDAQIKLGASAEQGSTQAKAIITQYAEEVKRTSAAVVAAKQSEANVARQTGIEQKRQYEEYAQAARAAAAVQSEASEQMTISQRRQYEEYIAQSKAEAEADRTTLSNRMAIGAEMRILEGSTAGAGRALSAYLSQFPLVAQASQAAFSAFAAVALIEVLAQVYNSVEKIVEAYHDMQSASIKARDQAIEDGDKIIKIKPASAFSTEGIANLFNDSPTQNTLEIKSSQAAIKEIESRKQIALAQAQVNEAGLQGEKLAAQRVKDAQAEKQILIEEKSAVDALEKGYRHIAEETVKIPVITGVGAAAGGPQLYKEVNKITDSDQQKELENRIRSTSQASRELDTQIQVVGLHVEALGKKEPLAGLKDADKEAREALQHIEEDFAHLNVAKSQVSGHPLTAGEATAFWSQYLSTFKAQSTEAEKVLNEFSKYQGDIHKQIQDSMKKQGEGKGSLDVQGADIAIKNAELLSSAMKKQYDDVYHVGEGWKEYNTQIAKGSEVTAQVAAQEKLAIIAQEESYGTLKAKGAAYQTATIHAEEYTLKLKALEEELARLQAEAKAAGSIDILGNNTDSKNAGQQAQIQNAIKQMQGQQAVSGTQGQTAITNAIAKPYITAFDDINNSWLKVQNSLIAGNKNIERSFVQMGVSLVQAGAQAAEKWLAQQAVTWIKNEASHLAMNTAIKAQDAASIASSAALSTAANTQKTAAVTAATATQTAAITAGAASQATVTSTTDIGAVLSYAAVAAAAAAAAVAGIPVVGPALAPAAAAATYATTAAYAGLAAFEQGGVVAGGHGMPVPIMAHAGERVLSAPQTQKFDSMVNGGAGSRGNSVHLNYNPQVSAYDKTGVSSMLRSHMSDIHSMVNEGIRSGSIKARG